MEMPGKSPNLLDVSRIGAMPCFVQIAGHASAGHRRSRQPILASQADEDLDQLVGVGRLGDARAASDTLRAPVKFTPHGIRMRRSHCVLLISLSFREQRLFGNRLGLGKQRLQCITGPFPGEAGVYAAKQNLARARSRPANCPRLAHSTQDAPKKPTQNRSRYRGVSNVS